MCVSVHRELLCVCVYECASRVIVRVCVCMSVHRELLCVCVCV